MTSYSAIIIAIVLVSEASAISVPTYKDTPIQPAVPTQRPVYHKKVPPPAPVVEYNEEYPEPEPLDPSYVPPVYKYITYLSGNGLFYVPVKMRNVPVFGGAEPGKVAPVIAERQVYEIAGKPIFYKYPKIFKPYYSPKANYEKVPTKGGYPKKVRSGINTY